MTVVICIAGAAVGLIVAAVSNWLVLPMVLQSLDRQPTIRLPLPAFLGDARALTIAIYRYVMPFFFAVAGGVAAYYLFIANGP